MKSGSDYFYQSGPLSSSAGGGAFDSSLELTNLSFVTSVSSNALTIALKGNDGNDPSVSNVVKIAFRSPTVTSAVYIQRSITAATSVVVSSGSTLGTTSGVAAYLYVYAIDSGGTVVLGVINGLLDEGSVQSSTAEGGAGAADSANVLYSTAAQTSKPVRLIGRILITEVTAGTWASNATELAVPPFESFQLLSVTSSVKTPGATDNWHALTGNSLTLTPGTWELFGFAKFNNNGSPPAYTNCISGWYGANGADTNTTPAALSTVTGLTVLSAKTDVPVTLGFGSFNQTEFTIETVIVRVTQAAVVYLDTYSTQTTSSNARITVFANAKRL